jgi:hypothetical protein
MGNEICKKKKQIINIVNGKESRKFMKILEKKRRAEMIVNINPKVVPFI